MESIRGPQYCSVLFSMPVASSGPVGLFTLGAFVNDSECRNGSVSLSGPV